MGAAAPKWIAREETVKAIALVSGGLDSTLSAKLVLDQGVQVLGLSLLSVFNPGLSAAGERSPAKRAADALGIDVTFMDHTDTMIALIKEPPHGHGANLNPCIDCHMGMLRRAAALMKETDAQIVVTGDVLGQRPMSQTRRALAVIDEGAGLAGLAVRPLCARRLWPTVPEKEGWIDREKLLDIHGRSRKRQMALARELGISDYPSPAGGCLVTDPGYTKRLRELIDHGEFTRENAQLLKVGRHLRLSDHLKLVVGRDAADCADLATLRSEGDVAMELADAPGPLGILRGRHSHDELLCAAGILARYSKLRGEANVRVRVSGGGADETVEVTPCGAREPERWLI